jgi:hypothetical protein
MEIDSIQDLWPFSKAIWLIAFVAAEATIWFLR